MKTIFKISPRFPVRHELAKLAARFCIRQAIPVCLKVNRKVPEQITFTMFGGRGWSRSGRAERNISRLVPHRNRNVFVRVKKTEVVYMERYHRYKNSPLCLVEGTIEMYVHLVAHELGHAICGFCGDKTGEFQCERFAARCLDAWRLAMQDPACMI